MPDNSQDAIIILAAGNSTRMGEAKQLLDFHGKPLLRHAVETALGAECGPVVVVLGAREQELRPVLSDLDVIVAVNERWSEGMGTSIQAGLAALGNLSAGGAVLALADQPLVTSRFLRRLVERHHKTGAAIVAARYSGTVGVPVFFSKAAFPYLEALGPDQGCKGVILKHSAEAMLEDCPEAAIDIDTPGDLQVALGL